MTVAIVICAGEGERWQNYTGHPKHLIKIEGERLLDRTVRLLRAHTDTVYVVSKPGDRRYESPGATRVDAHLTPEYGDADKFLSSRHLWNTEGRTLVVYGDCWLDEDAAATFFADRPDWTLYCRPGPSAYTGARSGECFAVGFYPQHHAEYERALHHVSRLWRAGAIKRCGGWETYRFMAGGPTADLRRHIMYGRHVVIDSWVDDFDKPHQLDEWLRRRSRRVSVLVPWRAGDPDREAAWDWVSARWRHRHPTWQLCVGEHDDGPWSKGAAIAKALADATGDILVVADADVWTDGVGDAVEAVHSGVRWAVPHTHVHRLDQASTARVLAGGELHGTTTRKPYVGYLGGGMTVVARHVLEQVPIDPRFRGWGQEDEAWALGLQCLHGQPVRGAAKLWHLWHPPAPKLTDRFGSFDSRDLYARYERAARSTRAMKALLAEAR